MNTLKRGRNRATEEFVRHYRLLVERTGDNPSAVGQALRNYPQLAVSIGRLCEIETALQRHRGYSNRRFIVQSHPEFGQAAKDFRTRWQIIVSDVLRDQRYRYAALDIAKEFTRCYLMLKGQTADDPASVDTLRKERPELDAAIRRADEIIYALGEPAEYSGSVKHSDEDRDRFSSKLKIILASELPQAFRAARSDYETRWTVACTLKPIQLKSPDELFQAEFDRDDTDGWLEQVIDDLPSGSQTNESVADAATTRPFDPKRDSAADAIFWAEDFYAAQQEWDDDLRVNYRVDEAFEWIHKTIGLDLYEIEKRWKEFPVIIVP